MYRGFNIKDIKFDDGRSLYDIGKAQSVEHNKAIAQELNRFILGNGKIDGTKMQSNWFPTIEADIFLSHSHKDLDLAITLAGWLRSRFGLNTFIDSSVWGYSNDLLKQIDNDYCKTGDNLYSYDRRNFSTSHVHMMLASALTMMIDKTEVLFFLNTPLSLSADDIKHKTMSPWIYFELTTSRFIRKPIPERLVPRVLNDSYKMAKTASLDIEYTVDFSEFVELGADQLKEWKAEANSEGIDSLDTLYKLHPLD
ncbi:MAG: hypothetical protein PHU60_06355 [Tissierellia bacterium]|nr:hypothetical protein [Tissierellia bacterium]